MEGLEVKVKDVLCVTGPDGIETCTAILDMTNIERLHLSRKIMNSILTEYDERYNETTNR